MLDITRSRFDVVAPYEIHSSVEAIEDSGICLVSKMDTDGVARVAPSLGAPDELFVGFSFNTLVKTSTQKVVEDFIVPAGGVIRLRWPVASIIGVPTFFNAAGTALTDVTASGDTWTATPHVGLLIRVTYTRSLSAREASQLFGDQPFNTLSTSGFNRSIGVVQSGWIYTDVFDTATEWVKANNTSVPLIAAANGVISTAPTVGSRIEPPCRITHAPTSIAPWLGVYVAN